jgi:hypothetical protein
VGIGKFNTQNSRICEAVADSHGVVVVRGGCLSRLKVIFPGKGFESDGCKSSTAANLECVIGGRLP